MQSEPTSNPNTQTSVLDDSEDTLNLADVIARLRNRTGLILAVSATLFAMVVVFVMQMTPLYTAKAFVRMSAPQANIVDLETVLQDQRPGSVIIQSEIEIIRSRGLLERVARKLDMIPAVTEAQPASGFRWYAPTSWFSRGASDASAMTPEQRKARAVTAAVNRLRGGLEVQTLGRSWIVGIGYQSADPQLAAEVANTIADEYLVAQLEAKYAAAERASAWLNERIRKLRQDVELAEQAVEEYRAETGLIQGQGDTTLLSEQISQINSQLIVAQSETAAEEVRLQQVQRVLRSGTAAAADVLSSPAILSLRQKEAELTREEAELAEEYGKRHPRRIAVNVQIEDTREKIAAEIRKYVRELENQVQIARSREAALSESLERLKTERTSASPEAAQLRTLEREASAKRALLDTFLDRFQETSVQQDFQQADAQIVSEADVPLGPSFPPFSSYLLIGLIASLAVGTGTGYAVDRIYDRGFRSGDQAEPELGVHFLGGVPDLDRVDTGSGTVPAETVLEKPNSVFSESLRSLHTGLLLSGIDDRPQTVMFTSTVPAEGKTSTALSLARLLAKSGHKILLIDADLRRSTVHERLGIDRGPGLVEVLTEESGISDSVQIDAPSGLHILTSGRKITNPQDVLAAKAMGSLLELLKADYDLILIDTPPVSLVSDARLLASAVDRTIFLIRWNDTHRSAVRRAVRQLQEAGTRIAGVALTMINPKQQVRYGYSDSAYYYSAYRGYYDS